MNIIENIFLLLFYLFQFWVLSYFVIVVVFVLIDFLEIRTAPIIFNSEKQQRNFSFAAIIPLHQNIDFLPPILDSLLKQRYTHVSFFFVADDCPTIQVPSEDDRIHIIYPKQALHSKIKSLQLALENIPENKFDAIAIFDADNLIHPEFFSVMNAYFNKGYKFVQSNILPKNIDTTFARLDTINDQYYNFIDRLAPSSVQLSAHIAGRGIVIDIAQYKLVSYTNMLGGFDKKLQCELAKNGLIGYAQDAVIYDEKVSSGANMQVQRTRWINAYFRYFSEAFRVFKQGVYQENFRLAFFGYNNMRPPLFIQLMLLLLIIYIDFFVSKIAFGISSVVFILYLLGFYYIMFVRNTMLGNFNSTKTILQIPLFFIRQVRALFNISKANKSFMQTNNNKVVFIDELLT